MSLGKPMELSQEVASTEHEEAMRTAMAGTGVHMATIDAARSLGIGWAQILQMMLQYGPMFINVLQAIINALITPAPPGPSPLPPPITPPSPSIQPTPRGSRAPTPRPAAAPKPAPHLEPGNSGSMANPKEPPGT